jgi:hypothetical protein
MKEWGANMMEDTKNKVDIKTTIEGDSPPSEKLAQRREFL